MKIFGVTGTNGKSSVVHFLSQFWASLGLKWATVGTQGVITEGNSYPLPNLLSTNDLSALLFDLEEQGIDKVAMELFSYQIDRGLYEMLKFNAIGFTNLSPEHLNYHKTIENYLDAKLRIFNSRQILNHAILNCDTIYYSNFYKKCRKENIDVCSYGKKGSIVLKNYSSSEKEASIKIEVEDTIYEFHSPLLGEIMIYNLLCSIGLLISDNINFLKVSPHLNKIQTLDGRLEKVSNFRGAEIYVDYAHTPHALNEILKIFRQRTSSKLVLVFGCGGERDISKRVEMGRVANKLASHIIITDDNPRTEDPVAIHREIKRGAKKASIIGNRRKAIRKGLELLNQGDIMVVAGKGDEIYQEYRDQIKFNDRNEIISLIKNMNYQ